MNAEAWVPEMGTLCVRTWVGIWGIEVELSYRYDPSNEHRYRKIAVMSDWLAMPSFDSVLECLEQQRDTTIRGDFVVRRQASDNDIRGFVRLWGGKASISEWLRNIQASPMLLEKEKVRVLHVAATYGHKP